MIGQNSRFLHSGKTPRESYISLWDALTHGQTWRGEFINRRKDGSEYIESAIVNPILQTDGRVTHYLAIKEDITARLSKEKQQAFLERQLQQAQKMNLIGQLTGGIAHDFNNILAAMLGFTELLQMTPEVQGNPQTNRYLQEILQAGIRAKELVAQLLTFSHRREMAVDTISVEPIVNEVLKLLQSTLPTSISIKATLADDLPQVLISPIHLHQILMNLGVNARDALKGKGILEIKAELVDLADMKCCDSCHTNYTGRFLMISVRDTGSGIAPENLLKIFDPFFTTKEIGQGSGLGLSVLHGIVHSANGHIEVLSVPGQESEFRIYLPPQSQKLETIPNNERAVSGNAPVCGHIMVVDDEESIVSFLTYLLENLGYCVTGLTSATEALRLFQDNPHCVDMVITDQTMPDLTGAELARAMLALRPDLPIVMNTGYNEVIDEESARQIGIRRFLIKPVPAKVFEDVVAECLAGKTINT